MRSFGKRVRNLAAATLSATLIVSGVALASPAAYADEGGTTETTQNTETPGAETPAAKETPVKEAPVAETPEPEIPKAESSASKAENKAPAESALPADSEKEAPATRSPNISPTSERSSLTTLDVDAPSIVASVTSADETGLKVQANVSDLVLRAAADNPDSEKNDSGVYISVVEKGGYSELTSEETGIGVQFVYLPLTAATASSALTLPSADLNRSKDYEVVAWRAHGNATAERFVASQGLDVTTAQWDDVFGPEVLAATATSSVVDSSEAGLEVMVEFKNVQPSTLRPPQNMGVYAALVEAGTSSPLTDGAFVDNANISDGAGSGTFTIPAVDLDRTKSYEALVWYAHGNPTAAATVARASLAVTAADWNAVFPPTVHGSASVTSANEDGITISTEVTGIDPTSYPIGVHVGVVLRGTSVGAQQKDFLGATDSIKPIPEDGAIHSDVMIPLASLDRGESYEVVVWPQRSIPSNSNIVKVLPFDLTTAQWDAVFGPEIAAPSISASVESADEAGLKLSATVENIVLRAGADVPDSGKDDVGVYIGIIEKDRVADYGSNASAGAKEDFAYKMFIFDGKVTRSIDVPAEKLNRTKDYVAVTWLAHGFMNDSRYLAQTDIKVTPGQWDAVFGAATANISVDSVAVSKSGLNVKVSAKNMPEKLYAALIERGTESKLKPDSEYPAFAVPFPTVVDGKTSFTLTATKKDVNRKKVYEVLIWEQHSLPDISTIYARTDVKISQANWDKLNGTTTPSSPNKPKPSKASAARAAGSLSWGISSSFAAYVTGDIAKGKISTSGVGKSGGNYLFPQAAASDWNFKTQTGTVRYSGVVNFTGHHGLMSETFTNPVIKVTSASSGSITVHGQTYALKLASGSKSVSDSGAVTWSNVPVSGGISGGGSGGGGSGGGSFAYNSLTFTAGAASSINFGSTAVTHPSEQNEAAATAPTTEGITLLTPEDELVAGGEIEFEANEFEANERDILVVMYSDPIVLDKNAGADANGKVHWVGTLPDDLHGEHTITLQGSADAGAVLDIMTQEEYDKAHADDAVVVSDESVEAVAQAAGPVIASEDAPIWVIWVCALGLIVVAGGMTGLVIAQRRRSGAGVTPEPSSQRMN